MFLCLVSNVVFGLISLNNAGKMAGGGTFPSRKSCWIQFLLTFWIFTHSIKKKASGYIELDQYCFNVNNSRCIYKEAESEDFLIMQLLPLPQSSSSSAGAFSPSRTPSYA